MCRTRGWRIAVVGCSQRRLGLWNDPGVVGQFPRVVPIGRDVVVEVAAFDMAGRNSEIAPGGEADPTISASPPKSWRERELTKSGL